MDTDKTPEEESVDQAQVDSETEQPEEQSQDQPEGVDDAEDGEDNDADEEVVEIDGKTYTPEELKEYVNKGRDYTKKTQQLAEERRAIEAERARYHSAQQQTPPSEEDEEIRRAKETLKKYNVAFADDVDAKIQQAQMRARQEDDFRAFKQKYNLSPQVATLVRVAGNAYKIPYEKAYEMMQKEITKASSKPVKRKIVGARKSASSSVSSKSGGVLTRADIKKMPVAQYNKLVESGKLDEMIAKGELK